MHLIRFLSFLKAKFQFALVASHIEGKRNVLANALSRDKLNIFFSRAGEPRPYSSPAGAPRPDHIIETGLDLSALDRTVDQYFRRGIAPSTTRTYDSAKRRYLHFCTSYHLHPLPLSETILSRFVAHLANEGLAPSNMKAYISALWHLQIAMGLPYPQVGDMARLEQVMKGAKREHARRSPSQRKRLPITPEVLHKISVLPLLLRLPTIRRGHSSFGGSVRWYSALECGRRSGG